MNAEPSTTLGSAIGAKPRKSSNFRPRHTRLVHEITDAGDQEHHGARRSDAEQRAIPQRLQSIAVVGKQVEVIVDVIAWNASAVGAWKRGKNEA